jgi:hypothetical protein
MKQSMISILCIALLLAAWWGYMNCQWLLDVLPGHMLGRVSSPVCIVPVYADYLPANLSDPGVRARLQTAVLVLTLGTIALWLLSRCRSGVLVMLGGVALMIAGSSSVAMIRAGEKSLVAPYERRGLEYFQDVPRVQDNPAEFVRMYPTLGRSISHHAGTHPPGAVLLLWAVGHYFDDSIQTAAWTSIAIGSLGAIPVYWLARQVSPRSSARRAVVMFCATPSLVIFNATSMDAVFTTLTLFALASGVWALRKPGWLSIVLAGAALWLATFFTFAAIVVPMLLGMLCFRHGRFFKRVATCISIGAAFIGFKRIAHAAFQYDIVATAHAALNRDFSGLRVTGYESLQIWTGLSVANLLAFLLGSGVVLSGSMIALSIPAIALWKRSHRFARAVALTLMLMSISTLFTLETERVWLPMAAVMGIALAKHRRAWWWVVGLSLVQTVLTEIYLRTWW